MKHAFIYGWILVVVLAFGWTGTLLAKEAKEPAKALQMACYDIVPLPNSVTLQAGEGFVLDGSCVVVACSDDENLRRNAQFLCEYLRDDVGLSLTVSSRPLKGKTVSLRLNDKMKEQEGYRLTVGKRGVTIEGKTANGVFYGIQTLRRALLSPDGQ